MLIKNGMVFCENGKFEKKDIEIKNGKIVCIFDTVATESACEKNCEIVNAEGLYVIPGLVDIHFHGSMGHDFCNGTKEAIEEIAKYQLSSGVTDIVLATMTLPEGALYSICKAAAGYRSSKGSNFRGITLEGPFISKEKKGAQCATSIQEPNISLFRELQETSGNLIKQVVVAPEEDNEFQFIRTVSKETVVSIGHTVADYETTKKAFKMGATHVTHLLNGMKEFCHRQPGVIGAAFDNPNVFVELICDGVHIHPSMVRAMFKIFGAERICMISDSIAATGMIDGMYSLGGQKVYVKDNVATLEDGTIAGSVVNLHQCLKLAVKKMHIPLESAVLACTKTPATSLGLEKECGILAQGRNANIVLLDHNLDIIHIFKDGHKV